MIISARSESPHYHPRALDMKVQLDGQPLPPNLHVIEFDSETRLAKVFERQPGTDFAEREVNGNFTIWLDGQQVA